VETYLEENPQINRFLREFDNNRFSMALLARMVPIPFGFSNAVLAVYFHSQKNLQRIVKGIEMRLVHKGMKVHEST